MKPEYQSDMSKWAESVRQIEQGNNGAAKVTLQCNECGKKRKVSPDGNYNDRCPKCGGVDWDVL